MILPTPHWYEVAHDPDKRFLHPEGSCFACGETNWRTYPAPYRGRVCDSCHPDPATMQTARQR